MLIKDYQNFTQQTLLSLEGNDFLSLSNKLVMEAGDIANLTAETYTEIQEYHKSPIDIEYLSSQNKERWIVELGDCVRCIVRFTIVLKELSNYEHHKDNIYLISTEKDFKEYSNFFEKRLAKDVSMILRIIDLFSLTGNICEKTQKIMQNPPSGVYDNHVENLVLNLKICLNVIALISLTINSNLNEVVERNVLQVKSYSMDKKHD